MRVRWRAHKAGLVVVSTALISACGSSGGTSASTGGGSGSTPSAVTAAKGPFSWTRYQGQTITLLDETQPWTTAITDLLPQFEKQTGITVKQDTYTEEQRRQLAVIQLQSGRPSFDVYMNLKSFSGPHYSQAGWYQNLYPFLHSTSLTSPSYNPSDFLKAPWQSQIINGSLDGVPTNVEGPVLFYRTDIFKQYGLTPPKTLAEVDSDAKTIEQKSGGSIVGLASRGLPAAVAYTFGTYLHNDGGHWSDLASPAGIQALTEYADTLRDYGPKGVVNYNFLQSSTLFGQGKAAMEFDSSNELSDILSKSTPTVANNFSVEEFPAGPGGEHPTVLSWSLAMSPYSKNQGPAWLFMQWATSPTVQTELAVKGIASPRASTADDPQYKATLTGARSAWSQALDRTLAQGNPNVGPAIVEQTQARQDIGLMVDSVILGQASPKDAATKAAGQLKALKSS